MDPMGWCSWQDASKSQLSAWRFGSSLVPLVLDGGAAALAESSPPTFLAPFSFGMLVFKTHGDLGIPHDLRYLRNPHIIINHNHQP
jgi:hypothetical protein